MEKKYSKPMIIEIGTFMELTNGAGKKKIECTEYVYNEEGKISKIIYTYLS